MANLKGLTIWHITFKYTQLIHPDLLVIVKFDY